MALAVWIIPILPRCEGLNMIIMHLWVSRQMKRILNGLARRRRITRAETIRRAVLLMKYLSDRQAAGDVIMVRDLNTGESIQLLMETAGQPRAI
ncbi:MAG: hypothetical protein WA041_02150 [Candidatus Microsaccharimonas sp.]